MLIADTSAWIEWLRATGSPSNIALRESLRTEQVLVPEVVRGELLTGARSDGETRMLRRLLEGVEPALIAPRDDFEAAINLYDRGRRGGTTVRGLLDCVIVATAARLGVPVLHHDRDIARLAIIAGVEQVDGSLVVDRS